MKIRLSTIADQTKLTQYLDVHPPDNRPAVFDSMDYAVAPPALLEQGAVSAVSYTHLDVYKRQVEGSTTPNVRWRAFPYTKG